MTGLRRCPGAPVGNAAVVDTGAVDRAAAHPTAVPAADLGRADVLAHTTVRLVGSALRGIWHRIVLPLVLLLIFVIVVVTWHRFPSSAFEVVAIAIDSEFGVRMIGMVECRCRLELRWP